MTAYIEAAIGWAFASAKGRDAKCFTRGPAFHADGALMEPTIRVTSPDYADAEGEGKTTTTLGPAHMNVGGEGQFPALRWELDGPAAEGVKEWLIFTEDPDAPFRTPICHGIYLGIPKEKTSVQNEDFEPAADASSAKNKKSTLLKGGFYYGANMRGLIYILPRPLLNHGIHRYIFDVVALSEPLSPELVASRPDREKVAEAIKGKVLAWGRWMGQCERNWN